MDIQQLFLQKKTFKDKFQVIWNYLAPSSNEYHDNISKTIDNSITWRKYGDNKYTSAKNENYLSDSIEAYTKSIAHAPVGSSELSLAYANRSAVLYKARLYDDCLVDIERALKSGYPDNLKTKLYVRQALCFKSLQLNSDDKSNASMASAMQWLPDLIKNNPKYNIQDEYLNMINELEKPFNNIEFTPKIINSNSIIVGGSDAIELIDINKNDQHHIVATKDLKTGEFIYINEPFATTIIPDMFYTNCWNCSRQTWSGVPCDNCSKIIYCSDKCKEIAWNSYHNIECLVLEQMLTTTLLNSEKLLTVKVFSKAINSIGSLIKLKQKIDEIDSMENEKMIITNDKLDVNTIDNFLCLDYCQPMSAKCNFDAVMHAVIIVSIFAQKTNIFGEKITLNNLINNNDERILIMGELLLRFMMIVNFNTYFIPDKEHNNGAVFLNIMSPFCKLLYSSCDPNVDTTFLGSNFGFYVCKPIQRGELLLSSFVGNYHTTTKTNRYIQMGLNTDEPVLCQCTACNEDWPTIRFLRSYMNMRLPIKVEEKLNHIMQRIQKWQMAVDQRDTKKLLKIKNSLNKMNDKFYKYVTGPCEEKSVLYLLIHRLYFHLQNSRMTLE